MLPMLIKFAAWLTGN